MVIDPGRAGRMRSSCDPPERRAAPCERGPLASPRAPRTLAPRYVCYPRFVFSLLKVHCTCSSTRSSTFVSLSNWNSQADLPDGPSVFCVSGAKFLLSRGGGGSTTPPPSATPGPSFGFDGHVTRWSEIPLFWFCGRKVTVWTSCWVAPPSRVLSVLSVPFCATAMEVPPTATTSAIRLRTRPGERCFLALLIIFPPLSGIGRHEPSTGPSLPAQTRPIGGS